MNIHDVIAKAGGIPELAVKLGIARTTVYDWQRTGTIPGNRVLQIAAALKIPPAKLFPLGQSATSDKARDSGGRKLMPSYQRHADDLFGKTPIELQEMVAEAEREVRMRKEVYARRVAHGAMSQAKAERGIAVMEAIVQQLKMLR